jgi:hypothetical protein
MRNSLKGFVASCFAVSLAARAGGQQSSVAPDERLVTIAPCRLVDTRLTAPTDATEERSRKFDVASTRCGRFVPSVATAYAMRITPYDRANEGKAPPPANAARTDLTRHPAGAAITFPVPPGTHITVDLEGYYVPPNTPTDPIPPAGTVGVTDTPGTSRAASAGTPLRPKAQSLHDGTVGELYLDASRYWPTAVFGSSNSTTSPWIMFMSGRSDGTDGFGVYNSNFSELMRVSSNGPIRLTQSWSYLSGRIDYRETPNIATNTVSEIQIVNPRDQSGGATNRVTFYDATSTDEYNSPPTTKFRAFTNGIQAHPDINFDSQIGYSFPNSPEYYYRAYSQVEGIETFWLKANTNFDAYHNTRADMYVNGNVGIGSPPSGVKLQVEDLNNNTDMLLSAGDSSGSPNSSTFSLMRKDGNHAQLAKYGLKLDATDGNKFKLLYGGTGAFAATSALVVDTAGNVGIGMNTPTAGNRFDVAGNARFSGNVDVGGVIYAKYQDVAEWVPSEGETPAGTVVILNPLKANVVTPSTKAYDTAVAGVVSDQPGVLLGVAGVNKAKIATTGRVRVRVDARTHAVHIGDLLVTSDIPGTAMLSEPLDLGGVKIHRPGTLIGKALEPLDGQKGEILVLLSLQ